MRIFRSRLVIFAALITAVCIGLMLYSGATGKPSFVTRALGAVVVPVQEGVSAVVDGLSDFFGYFYRYSSLVEENARLKEQVNKYQEMEQRYLSAISENTQLRKLTGLAMKYRDFDFEVCQVSSVYRGVAQVGMVLNKGASSGIEEGDVVMTEAGFVGYISTVGPTYSEVVTVLDISFKAEAKISRTKETVIAEGDFDLIDEGRFKLAYLPTDTDIKENDMVETSGYGGVYPAGLVLGRVDRVELDKSGLTCNAVLRPADDILELKWVYVVKDFEVID